MSDESSQHRREDILPYRMASRSASGACAASSTIEMELKAAHERLHHVLAVCPAIIYATEASGDYACTFVSENIEAILGYTQREMLDDPDFWTTHIHPQDTRRVLAEVFRLIPEGGGHLEYRFRHRDGHYRWFQDSFKTVYEGAGQPLEIVGSWADITQRKLAESFQTLYQASFKLREPLGLKKWFDGFLRTARDVLHVDRLTILLADPDNRWLQAVASTEPDDATMRLRVPIGREGGGLARAFQSQQAITCDGRTPIPAEHRLGPPYNRIEAFRSSVFAIMPLVVQNNTIGVLAAGWKGSRPFDPATIEPLKLLANQAAVASEHSRLYAAAQPVLRRSLELSEVYPAFAAAVKALLAYDRIGVVVPEGTQLLMALSVADPPLASWQGQSWPMADGTAGSWVLTERKSRIVRDLNELPKEEMFADDTFMIEEGVRSTLMLPLTAGADTVGFFFLDNRTPYAYTERDLELLEPVAQQLALAIQNSRLVKELQEQSRELARSVEQMQVLREVGQAVNSSLDLPTVLTRIVAHAVQLSGTDGGMIYEFDEEREVFMLRAAHGLPPQLVEDLRACAVRPGEGAVGRAAHSRVPIALADLAAQPPEPAMNKLLVGAGFGALLNVPLLRENRIFGGLCVCRRQPREFETQTVEPLQAFATQSALAIQNARQFHEIEEKGRQLELANRHKSQFLANMSHELRTPLNSILGHTELILDDIYGTVPQKIRDALQRVDRNGRHLLGLINDVLDLSKIEAGSLVLSLAEYSVSDVVQNTCTALEPLAAEKHLVLKFDVGADVPRAKGDERRITQVLLNLIANAIKFTDAGEIRVSASAHDGVLAIAVADTGRGIAAVDQRRIFDQFQQLEASNTRQKGGTGLGLSIAQRIVQMHGGRIWVESEPGKGAVFRISMPVRVERQAEAG